LLTFYKIFCKTFESKNSTEKKTKARFESQNEESFENQNKENAVETRVNLDSR
jgi:hypothetical protein